MRGVERNQWEPDPGILGSIMHGSNIFPPMPNEARNPGTNPDLGSRVSGGGGPIGLQ